jgi:hypothetical protein
MGSYTLPTSRALLRAMFPNNQGASANIITATAQTLTVQQRAAITVYGGAVATGNTPTGLYGGGSTQVRHAIHLIQAGTVSTPTGATALTDNNFTAVGVQNNLPGTATAISVPTNGTAATYGTYASQAMGLHALVSPDVAYTWKGWVLDATAASVKNEGQISFPQNNAGTGVTAPAAIVGFLIHTDVTTTASASGGGSITSGGGWRDGNSSSISTTLAGPVIIAYGDLSTFRLIQASDTPVFTDSAIVISLD